MCLVVDANKASDVFRRPDSDYAKPIWAWLRRDGILVFGGKLAAELAMVNEARRLLAELLRGGRAFQEKDGEIAAEEARLQEKGSYRSNDPHVIALCLVSGARVVATEDQLLMQDLKDPAIVKPRARIYRRPSHRNLLRHQSGCRAGRHRKS